MERIREIFERMAGPLPAWEALAPSARQMNVPAGGRVFAVEDEAPYVFVVQKGLLKLHHDGADGRERIKSFAQEGGIVASISALQRGGQASFSVTALEATALMRISYPALEAMAARHLEWGRLLRTVLMGYAAQKERREQGFLMQSAAERYQNMLQTQPSLLARVAQKDLAAYLGVTPVGLSRIAGRLREDAENLKP